MPYHLKADGLATSFNGDGLFLVGIDPDTNTVKDFSGRYTLTFGGTISTANWNGVSRKRWANSGGVAGPAFTGTKPRVQWDSTNSKRVLIVWANNGSTAELRAFGLSSSQWFGNFSSVDTTQPGLKITSEIGNGIAYLGDNNNVMAAVYLEWAGGTPCKAHSGRDTGSISHGTGFARPSSAIDWTLDYVGMRNSDGSMSGNGYTYFVAVADPTSWVDADYQTLLSDPFGTLLEAAAAAPVLSSPTGTPTGPTQATIGVTSDTAPTTTAISYQILPAATAAPSAATIVGAPDGTISTGSAGALTKAITALTTNTAVKVHFAQGATSNVVSSASFTPNTLASSGSPAAQSGTAGGGITWAGATPDSFITNHGNGSGSWAIVSSAGFSVAPSINSSTGNLSGGTMTSAGSYSPSVRYTDSSTVPGAQTVTLTLSLTVGASGDVTPPTLSSPAATGGTLSATGSVTSNEAGTLWWKMDGSATATDPGAGNEAGAGWTSQSMLAASNSVNFSTQPSGTRYGHFIGVDASGNRSTVANSAATTVAAGGGSYTLTTDTFAMNTGSGPRAAGTACSYSLFNGASIGSLVAASGVDGTGTLNTAGKLVVSGLPSSGPWEVQVKFADGGTARQQVTAV